MKRVRGSTKLQCDRALAAPPPIGGSGAKTTTSTVAGAPGAALAKQRPAWARATASFSIK